MLAAALAGVAALLSWGTYRAMHGRDPAPQMAEAGLNEGAAVVAQITGTHNCRWRDADLAVDYGAKLRIGQVVDLEEGLAEITFNDGATILLEGPAVLKLDAADKLGLNAGRMAAVVPQRSDGFRVHTQTLEVYEVGAEFGLWAQESGASEVHVFNGLVKSRRARRRRPHAAAARAQRRGSGPR